MENDPAIRVGSIVSITSVLLPGSGTRIGIIVEPATYDPGFREIMIPGIGIIEAPLERCYNATEKEKAEYFKLKLIYG